MSNRVYPSQIFGLMPSIVKTSEDDTIIQTSPGKVELRIAQTQNPIWHFNLIYEQLFNDLTNPNYSVSELQYLMGFRQASQGRFDSFLLDDTEDDTVTNQVMQLIADGTNGVSAAAVGSSAGTGFAIGDVLAVTSGGGSGAILKVASIGGGGAITGFSILNAGSGYTTTSGVSLSVLSGAGSGSPTANITAVAIYYTPLQRNQGGQFFEDVTDLQPSGITLLTANGVAKTIGTCGSNDAELHGPGLSLSGQSFMGLYLKWCAQPTPPINMSFKFYFRVRFEESKQDFEKFLQNLWTIGGAEGQRGSGTVKIVSARDVT